MRSTFVPLSLCAALAACGPSGDAAPAAPTTSAPTVATPAKPAPDPMKDVDAWKALSASERAAKAAQVVANTKASDPSEVEATRSFLVERGETAAIASLAKASIAAGGQAKWAHEAVGDVDVRPEVDACLHECEMCAEAQDEKYVSLKSARDKAGTTWWADAGTATKVRAQLKDLKAQDELLGSPYGQGVEHWVKWQRATDVMKNSPAIHGSRGPYVVFVSLMGKADKERLAKAKADAEKAKADKNWKKSAAEEEEESKAKAHANVLAASLAEVQPEEIERANKVLTKTLDLLADFYDGWIQNMGPVLGLVRYDEKNSDLATLFKMNVFATSQDYQLYNAKTGNGMGGFARAYYSPAEPRFITTYDGGDEEGVYGDQVQCHEATHQLVHFYTWDVSRRDLKRDLSWEDEYWVRPTWSTEGFAEFFSSFAVKDGKRVWMQPLDERLRDLWVLNEVVADKKWMPWDLKEFLVIRNSGQLQQKSAERARGRAEDVSSATGVMANLFYAKAWSLNYFLWYAEDGGKPKYRDRLIEYWKREFHLQFAQGKVVDVSPKEFRKIMGLAEDDKLAAFQKEWTAFEADLVAKSKRPEWTAMRAQIRKNLKIDK